MRLSLGFYRPGRTCIPPRLGPQSCRLLPRSSYRTSLAVLYEQQSKAAEPVFAEDVAIETVKAMISVMNEETADGFAAMKKIISFIGLIKYMA